MKRILAAIVVATLIISATPNVYAFSKSEENAIERQCKRVENAYKLTRSIIKWIKAD